MAVFTPERLPPPGLAWLAAARCGGEVCRAAALGAAGVDLAGGAVARGTLGRERWTATRGPVLGAEGLCRASGAVARGRPLWRTNDASWRELRRGGGGDEVVSPDLALGLGLAWPAVPRRGGDDGLPAAFGAAGAIRVDGAAARGELGCEGRAAALGPRLGAENPCRVPGGVVRGCVRSRLSAASGCSRWRAGDESARELPRGSALAVPDSRRSPPMTRWTGSGRVGAVRRAARGAASLRGTATGAPASRLLQP